MRSKFLLFFALPIGSIFLISSVLNSGGSAGGKTGSPGDGGTTCTQCHAGTAQQASLWITSNIPATGYVPGQTYTITATGTHTGVSRFGFEVTAEDADAAKKGTFLITNAAQTKLTNGGKAVTHTSGGITPSGNSKSWSFDWTAPAAGTGPVTFYGAFTAANGNGGTSGDVIYTSTYLVDEISTGIADNIADKAGLKAFPNPFNDYLEVSLESRETIREARVVSMTGAVVWSSNDLNDNTFRVESADFPSGAYQLVVLFEDGSRASRMVIRK